MIAEDDDECFDLITNADDGDFNSQYFGHLPENILKSVLMHLQRILSLKLLQSLQHE